MVCNMGRIGHVAISQMISARAVGPGAGSDGQCCRGELPRYERMAVLSVTPTAPRLHEFLARSLSPLVLTHALSPLLDLLRLLRDFVSGVTKCMQDFI
jgi:hypothetical protein